MNTVTRRGFLHLAGAAGFAAAALARHGIPSALAAEPFKRPGSPRLRLSLAAYSLRDFFESNKQRKGKAADSSKTIDLFKFIDYCADQNCDGAEVTAYYFPEEVSTDYLLRLKRHAFVRGIAISGSAIGNDFTVPAGAARDKQIADCKLWIDRAAILGAPHIRVFAGVAKGITPAEGKANCIKALEECCAYAGSKGVFLGLENHGGIVAEPEPILEIMRAVKSPWLGVNFDTGNFHTEDPYADLAKIAPYAVNVQIKAEVSPKGKSDHEAADLPRIVKILREANYQGFVALEYESKEDPWQAIPRLLKQLRPLLS
jgi:sugar phosphate isomerase/epimerase